MYLCNFIIVIKYSLINLSVLNAQKIVKNVCMMRTVLNALIIILNLILI
jgi:hypothetical protein